MLLWPEINPCVIDSELDTWPTELFHAAATPTCLIIASSHHKILVQFSKTGVHHLESHGYINSDEYRFRVNWDTALSVFVMLCLDIE